MGGKKLQTILLLSTAAICLIAAIVLFATMGSGDGYKKAIGIICGVLLAVLSVLFFLYWWLARDTQPNFFLYNRRTRKNMSVQDLTPQIVLDRMTFFLAQIASSPALLWSGNVLERSNNFGHKAVYKPLVVYKMLYDLSDKEPDSDYWQNLEDASPDVIQNMCNTLERIGEKQIVQAFLLLREQEPIPGPETKDFLRGNMEFFSGKMFSYVQKYIDYFY